MDRASARRPFASTTWADGDVEWEQAVDVVDARVLGRSWRVVVGLVREASEHEVLILNGAVPARLLYRDLVAAVVVRWTRRRCHLLITDATWSAGSAALERRVPALAALLPGLARTAVRALDSGRTHYAVLSTAEQRAFSQAWGVDPARVHFTPFPHTLYDTRDHEPSGDGGYLFSGGNSLRDYDLLEEAAVGLRGEVRVAAAWEPQHRGSRVSASSISPRQFIDMMRGCRAVVVPLRVTQRSAGQQTYLSAMLMGKPVIVTEAPGVRDYIDDGATGVVVPPDPRSLRRAMEHVLDPANAEHYRAMGGAARAAVLSRHTPEHYRRSLLGLAESIRAPRPAVRSSRS